MKSYKIADLYISIENHGEALQGKMKPYETRAGVCPDMTMVINKGKLRVSKEKYPYLTLDDWEYIRTGFAFAYRVLDFGGFCLHSSAVGLENQAILFSGPCGAGKSTQAALWQQYFGPDKAIVINDDKPVLRFLEDTFYVYGTPWSGKSDLHVNTRLPLAAVIFLKPARENQIRRLDSKEALKMLLYQSLRPNSTDGVHKLLALIEALLQKTAVYQLECNLNPGAVELVYNTVYSQIGQGKCILPAR